LNQLTTDIPNLHQSISPYYLQPPTLSTIPSDSPLPFKSTPILPTNTNIAISNLQSTFFQNQTTPHNPAFFAAPSNQSFILNATPPVNRACGVTHKLLDQHGNPAFHTLGPKLALLPPLVGLLYHSHVLTTEQQLAQDQEFEDYFKTLTLQHGDLNLKLLAKQVADLKNIGRKDG
jgi:hypothetical protein